MTNEQLARKAAERIDDTIDLPLQNLDDTLATIRRIIAETCAEAVPRWIPCSERMPGLWNSVLFVLVHRPPITQGTDVVYGCLCDNGCWFDIVETNHWPMDQVTHWQPLPQPPEERS